MSWFSNLFGQNATQIQEAAPCDLKAPNYLSDEFHDSMLSLKKGFNDAEIFNLVSYSPVLSRCVSSIRAEFGSIEIVQDGLKKKALAGLYTHEEVINAIYNPILYASKNDLLQKISWEQLSKGGCYLRVYEKQEKINVSKKRVLVIEVCPLNEWAVKTDLDNKELGIYKSSDEDLIPFINYYTDWIAKEEKGYAIKYFPNAFNSKNKYIPINSSLNPAKLHLLQYQEANIMLENKPISPSIISYTPASQLTNDQILAFDNAFNERLKGAKKQGSPIKVIGDAKVTPLSVASNILIDVKLTKQASQDIALSLGIPPDYIGIGNSTYENAKWATYNFKKMVHDHYGEPFVAAISTAFFANEDKLTLNDEELKALLGDLGKNK